MVHLLEQELGRPAERELLPMQSGDVSTTYAEVRDLVAAIHFLPAHRIEDGVARHAEPAAGVQRSTVVFSNNKNRRKPIRRPSGRSIARSKAIRRFASPAVSSDHGLKPPDSG